MNVSSDILNNDLIERFNWAESKVLEHGYNIDLYDDKTLVVDYTDDPELDYIMVLEALNDRRELDFGGAFKKIVFTL